MVARFQLAVSGYYGPEAWSWQLFDPRGRELARREVRLDATAWQYEAFQDLSGYVAARGAGRADEEARLVKETGDWIGEHVLGTGFSRVLQKPAVVTVAVPDTAACVARLPLEAARIGGRALHAYQVALVSVPADQPAASQPGRVKGQLRVLAVFPALPDAPALNQRRERRELEDLLEQIHAAKKKAVEFRALQYGVTSKSLGRALESYPGWDAVHICGHAAARLLLSFPQEQDPDRLGPPGDDDLAELLNLVDDRLKLVTVSPCLSSAVTAAAGLGLPLQLPPGPANPTHDWQTHGFPRVRKLASQLGCAVVTFRFPVPDDFAFAYFKELYELMVVSEQPLASAAVMALSHLAAHNAPALSMVAPVMFGSSAADLTLRAPALGPKAPRDEPASGGSMAPPYFAGRDDVMRAAGAALAMGSKQSGVLLYGVPGAGKSTCAAELASTRESLDYNNTFRLTLPFEIPTAERADIGEALRRFARSLNRIEKFPLSAALNDEDELALRLPEMSAFLYGERVLIVLENVEVLLTPEGGWRDPRWGQVIGMLTNHAGKSRLLMTSRRVPAIMDSRVLVLQVPPLRDDESLLVARNLNGIRALMHGLNPGVDPAAGKRLAGRILQATRGHPKLLELANAAVADQAQLSILLALADDVWQQGPPGRIFGAPGAAEDYVRLMEEWAAKIVQSLTAEARGFFQILCFLAEDDRGEGVIAANWRGLSALFCPPGTAHTCTELIDVLCQRALIAVAAAYETAPQDEAAVHGEASAQDGAAPRLAHTLRVHPVLADYGRRELPPEWRPMIAAELAGYWIRTAAAKMAAGESAACILSASSYLSRLDDASAWRVLDRLDVEGAADLAATITTMWTDLLRRAYAVAEPTRLARLHQHLSDRLLKAGDHQLGAAHLLAAELLRGDNENGAAGGETVPPVTAGLPCPKTLPALCEMLGPMGQGLQDLATTIHGGFNQVQEVLRGIVAQICAVPGAEEGS